eukprot:GAHX01000604.1.p1 GENE.GAHX01000604.1~~GAHX01000604.1.p1  ORF type:complete len:64 (-),score=2.62 GAHX01000604.1:139-330(-)
MVLGNTTFMNTRQNTTSEVELHLFSIADAKTLYISRDSISVGNVGLKLYIIKKLPEIGTKTLC